MTKRHGPVEVGVIGAGDISRQYLRTLTRFPDVNVLVIGNRTEERAVSQATKYAIPQAGGIDLVLHHPDVEIVLNLTAPAAHAEISEQILNCGKHLWTEKPLGITREQAFHLVELAGTAGLRIGVAPDTILGSGIQTTRRVIGRGDIGQVLFAQTAFQWQGPELFHPNPAFLYATGAGPLLDMGPYYLATLIYLFGSVTRVAALGLKASPNRTVLSGPQAGLQFPVEVPTTIQVLMEFESGVHAQSLYSTDSAIIRHGIVEVAGSQGTLALPDPNGFDGPLTLTRKLENLEGWPHDLAQEVVPVLTNEVAMGRGVGVLDMARGIRAGRPHVASAELGYHVLDTLLSIEEAVDAQQFVEVTSKISETFPLSVDFDPYQSSL